jgi:hypothetical protein
MTMFTWTILIMEVELFQVYSISAVNFIICVLIKCLSIYDLPS